MKTHGLTYYPQPCSYDGSIKRMVNTLNKESFFIYNILLKLIYGENGYYLAINNDTYSDMKSDYNISSVNKIKITVDFLLERGIFDKELHAKFNILTSKEIQRHFIRVTSRRKNLADIIVKQYFVASILPKIEKRLEIESRIEENDSKIKAKLNELQLVNKDISNCSDMSEVINNLEDEEMHKQASMKSGLAEEVVYYELYDKFNKEKYLDNSIPYWKDVHKKLLKALTFIVRLNKEVTIDLKKVKPDELVKAVYSLTFEYFTKLVHLSNEHIQKDDVENYEFYVIGIIIRWYRKKKEKV